MNATPRPPAAHAVALDEPVIVLTGARCGSTLLRMILDAHPELACPAEISVVKACAQLTEIWGTVYGDNLDGAVERRMHGAIRQVAGELFADYLARRGKRRWCEKSLGAAPLAGQFARLYPKAKFICLYRHAMDVIDSGLEASPWGLTGYGFERFAGAAGGNNVAALAAYWMEQTSQILTFESDHPGRCLRVHYERLAEQPGEVADEMFAFLGVCPQPGIAERCFINKTSMTGPGDHKLASTNAVTTSSVGRGARIPLDMIPPPQLQLMNILLTRLEYAAVDKAWRASLYPPPLLTTAGQHPPAEAGHRQRDGLPGSEFTTVAAAISARLRAAEQSPVPTVTQPASGMTGEFAVVAYTCDLPRQVRCWRVHLEAGAVKVAAWGDDNGDGADWTVTGDHRTWVCLLSGQLSVAAAVRAGLLRYIEPADGHPQSGSGPGRRDTMARDRITAFTRVLGFDPAAEAAGIQDEDL